MRLWTGTFSLAGCRRVIRECIAIGGYSFPARHQLINCDEWWRASYSKSVSDIAILSGNTIIISTCAVATLQNIKTSRYSSNQANPPIVPFNNQYQHLLTRLTWFTPPMPSGISTYPRTCSCSLLQKFVLNTELPLWWAAESIAPSSRRRGRLVEGKAFFRTHGRGMMV